MENSGDQLLERTGLAAWEPVLWIPEPEGQRATVRCVGALARRMMARERSRARSGGFLGYVLIAARERLPGRGRKLFPPLW